MKKTAFVFLLLLLLGALLAGCASDTLPSDLYVIAEDKTDVPVGAYTLEYSINKYEAYRSKYDLSVTVNVYDETNAVIPVQNNRTMTVEADKTYTAVISVYGVLHGKQSVIAGQYVFSAVNNPRRVSLLYESGEIINQYEVLYGETLPLSVLPEIPNVYPAKDDGVSYTTILSKNWMILSGSEYVPLTQEHLTGITSDVQIYAVFEYHSAPIAYSITFVANGGSETPVYEGDSQTRPPIPEKPTRDGYTFLGWCTDEACTQYYDWVQSGTLTENMTMYARWVRNTPNPSPDALFVFTEKVDERGNDYCVVTARNALNLTGDLVLPNHHNGKPVRYFAEKAFEKSQITSVYIPNTYRLDSQRVFSDCQLLTDVTFEEGNESTALATRFFWQCYHLTSIALPDGIQRIADSSFANCLALSSVTLPEKLVFLSTAAFSGCAALTSVTIPARTENIMGNAFLNCSALSEVIFPNDTRLHAVGEHAFDGTALDELILPERLREQNFVFGGATVLYQ